MRIGIIHYHLRPGGVTRVIEMEVEGLLGKGHEPVVFCGEPMPEGGRIPRHLVRVVPELAYGSSDWRGILAGVQEASKRFWGGEAEVLHVHNHALGKNSALPAAVREWSREGRAMLLQMHDFAENGRSSNYRLLREAFGAELGRTLYPLGGSQLLVVLTSSAARKLARCGGHPFVLPNPVLLVGCGSRRISEFWREKSLIVYPTRAIRRKNIGEFILHSLAAKPNELFVVSSSPVEKSELEILLSWQNHARERGFPVVFDAARQLGCSVYDLLCSADLCLTTSIEEGFGMAFLEPWAAGCGLAGRDLPWITSDFRNKGLNLATLSARYDVPEKWVDRQRFRRVLQQAIQRACESYSVKMPDSAVDEAEATIYRDGKADFGKLDEVEQMRVIERSLREGLPPRVLEWPSAKTISDNKTCVLENYSLEGYTAELLRLAEVAMARGSRPTGFLEANRVLEEFMDFSQFSILAGGPGGYCQG